MMNSSPRPRREIDAEAFHETGLARFAAFDLQFLLTGHRYHKLPEEPDAVSCQRSSAVTRC